MGESLGHVPVLLATRLSQHRVGHGGQSLLECVRQRLLLREQSGRVAVMNARFEHLAESFELGKVAQRPPCGDRVWGASFRRGQPRRCG